MKLFELFDNPGESKQSAWGTFGGPNDKDFFFIINKETGKVLPGRIDDNIVKIVKKGTQKYSPKWKKQLDQWIEYGIYVDEISRQSHRKILPQHKVNWSGSNPKDETFARWNFPKGTYTISFGAAEGGNYNNEKDELTGTGHAIKVLSIVVNILKKTIADPKVKHFVALASTKEPSRVRLYDKLMKPFGVKKEWEHGGYHYWLT